MFINKFMIIFLNKKRLFVDDEEAGDTHMYAIREDN